MYTEFHLETMKKRALDLERSERLFDWIYVDRGRVQF